MHKDNKRMLLLNQEWDNIHKELAEDSDRPHIHIFRLWTFIGLMALITFIVIAVVEVV